MKAAKATATTTKAEKAKAAMKAMKATQVKAMKTSAAMKAMRATTNIAMKAMTSNTNVAAEGGDQGDECHLEEERVWRDGRSVFFRCIRCSAISAARKPNGEPTDNSWRCAECWKDQPPWPWVK